MTALEAQKERVFVAPALNWLYSTLNDAGSFGCKLIFHLLSTSILFTNFWQTPWKRQSQLDTPGSSRLPWQV